MTGENTNAAKKSLEETEGADFNLLSHKLEKMKYDLCI